MEDFDILYMMKTPFYMGNFNKVSQEAASLEINSEDHRNMTLKNLLLVRTMTAKQDFTDLKQFMQELFKNPTQKNEVQNYSLLVQYFAQNVR